MILYISACIAYWQKHNLATKNQIIRLLFLKTL